MTKVKLGFVNQLTGEIFVTAPIGIVERLAKLNHDLKLDVTQNGDAYVEIEND